MRVRVSCGGLTARRLMRSSYSNERLNVAGAARASQARFHDRQWVPRAHPPLDGVAVLHCRRPGQLPGARPGARARPAPWRRRLAHRLLQHPGACRARHRAAVAMALDPRAARDRSAVRRRPRAPRVAQIEFAARMAHNAAPTHKMKGNEWRAVGSLVPYLLEYKWRVAVAMACLITAKLANVAVPLIMKQVVDRLDAQTAVVAVPVALLAIYGILRFSATLFAELRDVVFVPVTQRAIRRLALGVFRHLHSLSLRFHLERQTGGMTRDIERGTRGISTLLSYLVFSILPVILEFTLVAVVLVAKFDWRFAAVTFGAVAAYIAFTVTVTEWRMEIRRRANELDSKANTRAIDSLLNYETVKYFNNEEYEARRYDENLQKYESAAVKNEASLGLLNIGQSLIITVAVTALMLLAAEGVAAKAFTLGDLVLVNGLLIQLYIPLNFLGMVYREIKQALLDMDRMFRLLHAHREVEDTPGAAAVPAGPATIEFRHVDFHYERERQILFDVSFTIPAGHRVAVVGHSGAGKSTLARLLYRFYDISSGSLVINGKDIREVKQASLRAAIGIGPQDTVLFNDSILYNIRYGRPEASDAEVIEAARAAHIHDFIESR